MMEKIHYATKTLNKSFIDLWHELNYIGVENNIFMLKTLDPDLVDFDKSKLEEYRKTGLMDKIFNEAIRNPWFFFRELVTIPFDFCFSGMYKNPDENQFILSPKSLELLFLYTEGISFIVNKRESMRDGMGTLFRLIELYEDFVTTSYSKMTDTFIMHYLGDLSEKEIHKRSERLENRFRSLYYSLTPFVTSDMSRPDIMVYDKISFLDEKEAFYEKTGLMRKGFIHTTEINDEIFRIMRYMKYSLNGSVYILTEDKIPEEYFTVNSDKWIDNAYIIRTRDSISPNIGDSFVYDNVRSLQNSNKIVYYD